MALIKESAAYSTDFGADRNDCMVRAISIAMNLPYHDVHALLAKYGRKPNEGTRKATTEAALQELGVKHDDITWSWSVLARNDRGHFYTLAQWLKKHPKGRYVVCRKGHAFAVVDGVVHDWSTGTGPRTRIRWTAKVG